ncbi:MAG: amidohydrolase family protein [Betaproteobacteria bacterium]|nr:amidohydrolase family protein [Betaproteobacteria bacterium]
MGSSLIRGRHVICKVLDKTRVQMIEDGAVFQRDGTIVEIGKHRALAQKYHPDEILGSGEHIVLPGFVNSHHHVGLIPFQTGSPDAPLELWFASRLGRRDVDLYLDTLYAAFEMIGSGVTTVQHLHSRVNGPAQRIHAAASHVIKAYRDIGMRVSYSFGLRDQNRLVYAPDEQFVARLPADLGAEVAELLRAQAIPLEENFSLFEQLYGEHHGAERVRIQLAPVNLHWCSDRALTMARDCAEKYDVPLHMHLLETRYQKEYARRRTGATAVRHLQSLGLLGPNLTLGHGVWFTESDIDLIAETGTRVCHNASSNLRLRSGIAPLNPLSERGVRVAIGLDEAGINEDRDMLQEMRLVLRLHRVPGMDERVPGASQVLQMATEHGAATTPFGANIGTLEPGKAADIAIISWKDIALPYLDDEVPVVDAVLHRARKAQTVLVAGEPILRDGRFTRLNKEEMLEQFAASLRVPLRPAEARRREVARQLLPHVERFYRDEGYLDEPTGAPFYHVNRKS